MTRKRQGIKRYASLLLSLVLIFSLSGLASGRPKQPAPNTKSFSISAKGSRHSWLLRNQRVDSARAGSCSEQEWIIISHYWGNKDSNQASSISITSSKTNKRIKTLYLYESGSKSIPGMSEGLRSAKTSVGGVRQKVYKIPLSTISSKKDYGNIVMTPYALGHKASYATYSDGILWIGEYMDGEDQGASSVRRDLRASCEAIH